MSHAKIGGSTLAAAAIAGALVVPGAGASAQEHARPVAEAPAHGAYAVAIDSARARIAADMERLGIPGIQAAVAVDGEIVWSEGFGYADLENRVPVWPHTRLRIASISKALTAAGVGRLVEDGKLDLDAPVQEYVPSFPEKEKGTVTTRLVAGHLAGIRHYRGDEFSSRKHYDDVVEALEIFADDTLQTPPGEEYAYSTYGWNLVSAVVQGAAGVPYLRYMREAVIEPAGMGSTVAEHVDSIIAHRARFYARQDDSVLVNAPYVDLSNKWAGGGYLSTAEDLVRYGVALLDGTLLEPETVDLLWTSQETSGGEETGYGIGWRVGTVEGHRSVSHTGGAMGGGGILVLYPEDGVVVGMLENQDVDNHSETGHAIARFFAGGE